jgi:hypothetical protein
MRDGGDGIPEGSGIGGPAYAARIGDLRPWHFVEAICFKCRHVERIASERLRRMVMRRSQRIGRLHHSESMVDHERLVDIERRLACRHCGNREMNKLVVHKMPRNG